MISFGFYNVQGILACFLVFFCNKICICQRRDLRPSPSVHRPKPTTSLLYRTPNEPRHGFQHLPSSAAPDQRPRSPDPPKIRPSVSRGPPPASHTTQAPVPSQTYSNCSMLKPDKDIRESIPLQANLIAIKLDQQYQGAWLFSLDNRKWNPVRCSIYGQVRVLSIRSFMRFEARFSFHGAVKFRASEFKGMVRAGSCVSMTTKPMIQHTVAVVIPPREVPFSIAKVKDKTEINEDEIDQRGNRLSELFAIMNRTQLVVDKASLDCIPVAIKEHYLAQIKEFNTNARSALALIQPFELRLGTIEYKLNQSFPWMPLPLFDKHSYPLPLNAFVRLIPEPNVNGKTLLKVVASTVIPRAEPNGFKDLGCTRIFLKEMDKKNYVYGTLMEVLFKAFEKAKENGTVTIDGMITSLQQMSRTADRLSLVDFKRALEILGKVKQVCEGRLDKLSFFKWYNKTIAPYVRKTPCEMIHGSSICLYSKKEIELPIHIMPIDDQPTIEEPRVYFAPIPDRLDSTYEEGVPTSMLMKVDQMVVKKLIFGGKSDIVRKVMAKGSNPDSLIGHLPKHEQRMAYYQKRKCAHDNDGDELGMAILESSPGIRIETFGRWLFKKLGSSSWLPLKKAFQNLTSRQRRDLGQFKRLALVKQGDRLKFEPRDSSLLWDNANAQEFTRVDFHAWEGNDNRTSGVQYVDFSTSSARFSIRTSSLIATRLGCNNIPGSMAKHDSCGICMGKDDCVGCDGVPNSGAKTECGICYGGRTGIRKPQFDCAGGCNTSYVDECGECQSWSKLKRDFKDCAGTCMRTPGFGARISKCKVCVGGVTDKPENSKMDACGICDGDNSTCTDCSGTVRGPKRTDDCNRCRDPRSTDFNNCLQITSVSSVTLPASGPSYVTVQATGIKTAQTAKCVLQNSARNISLPIATVRMTSATGVSSFYLQIKTVVPGSYSLKCKVDSSATEMEFTKNKLLFYDDGSVVVSTAIPSFALRYQATNVTLNGSGFMNRTTTKCVLEVPKSTFLTTFLILEARFISSSRIMCLVPPSWKTGEFKLGVVFSGTYVGIKKTPFSIKSIAPRPIYCELSEQQKLLVRFDQAAAALTRSAKCQDLRLFSSSSAKLLGSRARCRFKGKELQVSLPPDAPFIESGHGLTLIYRQIRNAFGKLTHYQPGISEVHVNCSRPAKPKTLIVELRGARTAGPCQNFKIKAIATGSVRLRYAWTAYFSNKTQNNSVALQDDMRNLTIELSKKTQKSITIPKHFVLPNVEYVIEVTVTDFWRQEAKEVMFIIRDNSDAPRIFIAGPKTRKVYLNRKFKLKAFIAVSTLCQKGSERDTAVLYTWSCSSDSVSLSKIDSKILFVNTSQLSPRKQYVFQIMACLTNNQSQCSRASVTVVTASQPLKCRIKDGKRRSIGERDQLKLDSRESSDPDADPKPMKYSWSCEDPHGHTCYYPNKTKPGVLIRLGIPDQSVVRINTAEQLPEVNGTYKFSLTVSKGNRSSTCETKIKVERDSSSKTKLFETLKANPDEKIVVRGQIETEASDTQYEFSIVEESEEGFGYFNLEEETDLVKSKIKGSVEKPDPRKPTRKNLFLIFNSGKLAGNATYRIRLTARQGNTTSYAEIDLKTKARPSEGQVLIEPSEGIAANTSFTIASGDGWSVAEEDGPLVYRCGWIGQDRRGSKKSEYFEDLSEKDSCETTLPAGSKGENYTLTCFIKACDVHGSCVRAEKNATVTPKKFTADDYTKAKNLVLEGFNQKDMTKAIRAILAAVTAAQPKKDDPESSQGSEDEEDFEGKKAEKEAFETFIDKSVDFNENGDAQSEDEKSRLKEALTRVVESADDDSLKKRKNRLSDTFSKIDKAEEREGNGGRGEGKRRRRRAVGETTPEVQEKTPEQAEQSLIMYRRIIEPLNFGNDSMTIKEQFLSTLDELGRSMCKGITTGELPLAAESNVTVLRSEKNSFENVHINFSRIGCDNCTFYDSSKIAHVLLGKSLKDMYEDWDCVEDGCNGACVVSSQMSDDLLVNSLNENKSRVSDVVYIKLFNPETLVAMTIPQLAMPVTFYIPLNNVTLAHSPNIQCYKWDESFSSWTTTDVSTNAMASEGSQISINCTSSRLGFFAVFEMTSDQIQSTTTNPTTAATDATVSTVSSPASQTDVNSASEPTTHTPSPTEGASATSNIEQQQRIQFSFDANYDAVINNNNKASVIATIQTSIASQLGVDPSRIINLSVHPGSIIVQFTLLPDGTGQQNVQNLTNAFRNMVQSGSFTVILSNGQRLDVIQSSFLQGLSIPSITPPLPTVQSTVSDKVKKSGLSQTTLIAIITAGSVFVVIIIAVVVFCCLKKKDQNQKVKAIEEEEEYQEAPVKSKNAKGDIPITGNHNEGRVVDEKDPETKRSEESTTSLPGTPTYDRH